MAKPGRVLKIKNLFPVTPDVYNDTAFNGNWSRESSDQKLVASLKQRGYKSLVADLLKE